MPAASRPAPGFAPTFTLSIALAAAVTWPDAHAAESGLDEIVVTATRLEADRLATPWSIDRIDAGALALLGATHSSEIINRVPGAMIQRGSGQESLTAIRSPVLTGAGSCGAFLFLENGVPIRPTGFCNVNELLEVNTEQADAIEVLRGTGSALYGSNSLHGTVNVLHAGVPEREPLHLGLQAGPSRYGRLDLRATHDGERADGGLKALYTHDGGWRDDSGFDEAKFLGTLQDGGDGLPWRADLSATTLDQQTAGFVLGRNAYRDDALSRSNPNPEAYRDAHAVRLTGYVQPDIARPATLELRPYLRTSRMEFLQHFLLGQPLERNGQESAGVLGSLRFDAGERTRVVTGLDLEWAESFLLQVQDGPTTGGPPAANAIRPAGRQYDYEVTSGVAAAYAQFDWSLGRWLLGAGARLEYVRYDYDNRMLAGNTDQDGVPCRPAPCLYSRPADRRDEFVNFAPKLSATWRPLDGLSLYANASRGFRPPEMTELYRLQRNQSVADLDSERMDAWELGLRGALERWSFDLAGFDMTKRNVILRESNGFNVGDGRTTHRGIEYQVTWQALDALAATVGGTWARHRYDFSRAIEGGETIVRGNDIDTAPRELLRAALEFSPAPSLATEAEWLMVGGYYLDASNLHRYGGHELLNLRGRWTFAPGWALSLRLNNALDRDYADRADFAFGSYRYFPGRPRSLFAELTWTPR
jgi:outer membrane receptor protein involved in Fe transport